MRCLTFAALIVAVSLLEGCGDKYLEQCETQLKEKLVAPATYKRVSVDGGPGLFIYEITYDPSNRAGVPLRMHGNCYVDLKKDRVSWFPELTDEYPELKQYH